jgi:oxygen-independent coproporphyrinogen-3 oxidase
VTQLTVVFETPIPLSLYVHLPWCVRKCPYCDFNSHPGEPDQMLEQAYVDALLLDLEHDLPRVWGRRIDSVFIGGGTPSLFSPESIGALLSGIRARIPIRADCEITLEANPGTVDRDRFSGYREMGVNRLSIGLQSFQDPLLARLGRIHDGAAASMAAESARAAGFSNVNFDLMFGLPGQTLEEAVYDIELACKLAPTHLSHYQLTIEPNTEFAVRPPTLPGEDLAADMELTCSRLLKAAGFTRYEVSAHAQAGQQCRHNLNYWRFGDYLGIGAGAHSKLTDVASGQVIRRARFRQPKRYLAAAGQAAAVATTKRLDADDLVLEFVLNALRLTEGFTGSLFEQRTGLALSHLGPGLERARQRGLLDDSADRIRATPLGRRFLNDVIEGFLGDASAAYGQTDERLHADLL